MKITRFRTPVLITCLVAGLSACATMGPQLSREKWMEIRNRNYSDVSPERLIGAAEQLFVLADGSDFKFSYPDSDTMEAVRWAAPFPVHIWFHWDLSVNEAGQGSDTTVSIWTTAAGFAVPGGRTPHDSPDVIRLFYDRLDYLLGRSDIWYSCDAYKDRYPDATTLEALCLLAKDDFP